MLTFDKQDLKEILNGNEKNLLDDFIDKMLKLNIIESIIGCSKEYEFINIFYFAYLLIVSTFEDEFFS